MNRYPIDILNDYKDPIILGAYGIAAWYIYASELPLIPNEYAKFLAIGLMALGAVTYFTGVMKANKQPAAQQSKPPTPEDKLFKLEK